MHRPPILLAIAVFLSSLHLPCHGYADDADFKSIIGKNVKLTSKEGGHLKVERGEISEIRPEQGGIKSFTIRYVGSDRDIHWMLISAASLKTLEVPSQNLVFEYSPAQGVLLQQQELNAAHQGAVRKPNGENPLDAYLGTWITDSKIPFSVVRDKGNDTLRIKISGDINIRWLDVRMHLEGESVVTDKAEITFQGDPSVRTRDIVWKMHKSGGKMLVISEYIKWDEHGHETERIPTTFEVQRIRSEDYATNVAARNLNKIKAEQERLAQTQNENRQVSQNRNTNTHGRMTGNAGMQFNWANTSARNTATEKASNKTKVAIDTTPRENEIAYRYYYCGLGGLGYCGWVTFILSVSPGKLNDDHTKQLVTLKGIRCFGLAHHEQRSNLPAMPFPDPRGYKIYDAPAEWGKTVKIGDTAWIDVAELNNRKGPDGTLTETDQLGKQIAGTVVGVGVLGKGLSELSKHIPESTGGHLERRLSSCSWCGGRGYDSNPLLNHPTTCLRCGGSGLHDEDVWVPDK